MDDEAATRQSGFRIGKVRGIPVIISPTWLILAVLVTLIYSDVVSRLLPTASVGVIYVVSFGFVVTLCGSVFLHELGHALVSLRFGIPVRRITLEMLGGHTQMATEAETPRVEASIALAGPAVSAVLGVAGLAGLALTQPGTLPGQFAFQIAACNIIVAVYNSLPGLPLDGGRALRALVWAVTGDRYRGTRAAGWSGRVVAAGTGIVGVWLYYIGALSLIGVVFALLVAAVLWMGASRAITMGRLGARFHLLDARRMMLPVVTVAGSTPLAEALRRMSEEGAAGVVVTDGGGAPVAMMHGAAAKAVPAGRRPWVGVGDVSRNLDETNSWDVSLRGEAMVRAMRAHPSTEYAVLSGRSVLGVVRMADIADVVDPRRTPPAAGRAGESHRRVPAPDDDA